MTTIHITTFVRRQTQASPFSHWTISDEELLSRVQAGLPSAKPGYRDGVLLVPVEPSSFYTGLVRLKEGDVLVGEYKARRPGEDPRKSTFAVAANKLPAKSVWIILYRHDVLVEGKENETDCDFEIVSVNASPEIEDAPIPTGALIANHYELSGGTSTKMSDAEFAAALKASVEFWKDKALICPEYLRPKPTAAAERFLDLFGTLTQVISYADLQKLFGPANIANLYDRFAEAWRERFGPDMPLPKAKE